MNYRALFAASLFVSIPLAACAVGSASEATDSTGEGLSKVATVPTVVSAPLPQPPVIPAFPPSLNYCRRDEPTCSSELAVGRDALNAELASLGCAPARYWLTGNQSGLLGGIMSVCTDSPAVRARFPSYATMADTCTACLPRLPAGDDYVLIEPFLGPNCQSGCKGTPVHSPGG